MTQQKRSQQSQIQRQQRQERFDPRCTSTLRRVNDARHEEDASSYSSNCISNCSEHFLGIRMEFPQGLFLCHSNPPLQPEPWIGRTNGCTFVDTAPNQGTKIPSTGGPPLATSTPHTTAKGFAVTRSQHQYRSNNVARKSSPAEQNKSRLPPAVLSPEQKQLQELYMDARRHEAVVARVTSPSDLEKMTYTLPAAKIASSLPPLPKQKQKVGARWLSTHHHQNNGPSLREGGGPKSTRASTAAVFALSQADPVHDFDYQPKVDKRPFPGNSCSLHSRKRHGWKSLLSRKLVPRSSLFAAPFEI
jgi:hypothetical protein